MTPQTLQPILTTAGLAAVAAAQGDGVAARISHIALGDGQTPIRDGAGLPLAAAQARTALIGERVRVPITAAAAETANSVLVVATIPAAAPSFWVQEVGIVLDDGVLLGYWSDPALTVGWRGDTVEWLLRAALSWADLDPGAVTVVYTGDTNHAALTTSLTQLDGKVRHTVETSGQTWSTGDNTQLTEAIERHLAQGHTALPYPTIGTEDRRLPVTPAAGSAGGTLSIAAGTLITLSEEAGSGRGRLRTLETPAWTSPPLAADATHYLRARITDGTLEIYAQQGTDIDAVPPGLIGTPGATAGGGFDSTVLDVLIARVVTGPAGSAPTVTTLANAAVLRVSAQVSRTVISPDTDNSYMPYDLTLDWARKPEDVLVVLVGYTNATGVLPDTDYEWRDNITYSRYEVSGQVQVDFMGSNVSNILHILAEV